MLTRSVPIQPEARDFGVPRLVDIERSIEMFDDHDENGLAQAMTCSVVSFTVRYCAPTFVWPKTCLASCV